MPPKSKLFDKLYEAVGLNKQQDHDVKLLEPPKNKRGGKFNVMFPSMFQADLIYMPEDQGFNYILDVVDVSTHDVDAEPLVGRTTDHIIQGFERIFKRKYIKRETMKFLYTDNGSEFANAEFETYCKQNDIIHRMSRPYRKNQTGVVEYMNGLFTKVLGTSMTVGELRMEERNTVWVKHLPNIIKTLNENRREPKKIREFFHDPVIKPSDTDLKEGDYVHIVLEKPVDAITEQNTNATKFRHGDLRYTKKVYKIVLITSYPSQPMRYMVEGYKNVSFLRGELVKATQTNQEQKEHEENKRKDDEEEKKRERDNDPSRRRTLELRNRTVRV